MDVHNKPKYFDHRLGRDAWRSRLIELFPEEVEGIDMYLKKLKVRKSGIIFDDM